MYRDSNRVRKTPQDTKFWQYASNLKKAGHKTIVHALAWEYPDIYKLLLQLLKRDTPLERITILLWRDYPTQMKKFEQKGFGTFSTTALKRFRDKYFLTGNMPNPDGIRKAKEIEASRLEEELVRIKEMLAKFSEVEKKVHLTHSGELLRKQAFETTSKLLEIQRQLSNFGG